MEKLLKSAGRYIDPPLCVLGDVRKHSENKIALIYSFIWDHDTPVGLKIDLERVWIVIDQSKRKVEDINYCSHFEISSLLCNRKISINDWNLKFCRGTHGPLLFRNLKNAYKGYPIIHFELFHEGKNGDVCFYPPPKDLRGKTRDADIDPKKLNGVHGWKFPEIWLPFWLNINLDLIKMGVSEYFCPNIKYSQLFEDHHRIKISKFSLMKYTLKMSLKESDRVIADSNIYYPIND